MRDDGQLRVSRAKLAANDQNSEVLGPIRRLGKYELIARLGTGGMAEVFLARQRGPMGFEKVVVVKTIHEHLARKKEFVDMLLDEARISALLKHPCVIDIYDLGVQDGTYFIAMEYLSGQPVVAFLKAGQQQHRLDVCSIAQIIADAADGLHAAHNLHNLSGQSLELVHRDVTPGNIMVLYDGRVKLVDFGVSKAQGRITETGKGKLKGKLGYVSPEQVDDLELDCRSDIFSLGVVAWEFLTYRRLFRADSPAGTINKIKKGNVPRASTYRPDVPWPLDEVVARALNVDRAERYQTAAEMREDLWDFLRAASYDHQASPVVGFMEDVFGEERRAQEELLRKAATANEVIDSPSGSIRAFAEETMEPIPGSQTTSHPGRRTPRLLLVLLAGAVGALAFLAGSQGWLGRQDEVPGATHTAVDDPKPRPDATEAKSARVALDAEPVAAKPAATPDAAVSAKADASDSPSWRPQEDVAKAQSLYQTGARLYVQGRLDEAKRVFRSAIKAAPRFAPSHRGLGLVYARSRDKKKAIRSFRRYLKLAPEATDAASVRAQISGLKE